MVDPQHSSSLPLPHPPTATQTRVPERTEGSEVIQPTHEERPEQEPIGYIGTLRLTATRHIEEAPRLKWDEEVVDNEKMGKKSSKICCIYRKPWAFGESDSDSSDEDNRDKNAYERQPKHKKKAHSHQH